MNELKFALKQGVNINVDNFQELDRIKDILAEETHSQSDSKEEARVIGLRINPQIGSGSIASSSTATKTSKFGVPIDEKTNVSTPLSPNSPSLDSLSL
jgi:diaminopimelate decarboxylase